MAVDAARGIGTRIPSADRKERPRCRDRERTRAGVRPDAQRQSGVRFEFAGRDERLLGMKMASRTARPDGEEQPGDQGGGEGPNKSPSLPPRKGRRRLLDSAYAVIRRRC